MNVLNYCAGYDTGGYSIRLKQAFDRHSEFGYRSCIGRPVSYIRYPTDARPNQFNQLVQWADLIHVSHQPVRSSKPQVVQYHGTKFRNNPDKFLALQQSAGAKAVVSTLDLLLLAPDMVTWLPSPYDLNWLAQFRNPQDDGVFRIGHAPTNRAVKSTEKLIAAVNRLAKQVRIELVLIEKQSWMQCLAMKGRVDVYFDQVILGYGNNAVEAWGMGIPVIAGAAPGTLKEMKHRFGRLPFLNATEDSIFEALVAITAREIREDYTRRGVEFVHQWHDAERVVHAAEMIYRGLGS